MIWFNVTNVIQIDGEVSADGRKGDNSGSGGGSGGSIWMHCYRMKGICIYLVHWTKLFWIDVLQQIIKTRKVTRKMFAIVLS